MRNQTIFNRVLKHLRTMDGQSREDGGDACLYRSPSGNKCAIGCLIPNKDYEPSMEGWSVTNLLFKFKKIDSLFKSEQLDLLEALQQCHDDYELWNGKLFIGNPAMRRIAKIYGLQYTPKGA